MNTKTRGELTEQIVITEVMKLGFPVSKPLGDNLPYDIIIDYKGKLLKCQIKTARMLSPNSLEFKTTRTRINSKKFYTKDYVGLIDIFLAYSPYLNKVFYVPIEKCNTRSSFTIRLGASKNSQKKRVNKIEDYELALLSDRWVV